MHLRVCMPRSALLTAWWPVQAEANKEGFMWDPSNARWKRVSAEKNEKSGGKFGSDKWMEGGGAVIKAKSGGEYTVWPMIHQVS